MHNEPAITVGAITSVVTALFAMLVSFGVDLTGEQQAAIVGMIATVAPLAAALLTRRKVAPTAGASAEPAGPAPVSPAS